MKQAENRRKGQSGQAIVELAICLVAFIVVISGFFLIIGLGTENVRNIIEAREEADQNARDGVSISGGQSIQSWDYGEDKILFTQDDKVNERNFQWNDLYQEQLEDDESRFNLCSPYTLSHIPDHNNFAVNLSSDDLFFSAASLASATKTEDDPLTKRNLCSLRHLVQKMVSNSTFRLKDSAFMPSSPVLTENQ